MVSIPPSTTSMVFTARLAGATACRSVERVLVGRDGDEPNVVAGVDDDGRMTRGVEQRDGRAADQAPPARAFDRVDARLHLGDAHRAGGDGRPGRFEARRGNPLRQAAEIRESGTEPHHVDQVVGARVDGHHLVFGETVVGRHETEVRPECAPVGRGDLHHPRRRNRRVIEAGCERSRGAPVVRRMSSAAGRTTPAATGRSARGRERRRGAGPQPRGTTRGRGG